MHPWPDMAPISTAQKVPGKDRATVDGSGRGAGGWPGGARKRWPPGWLG